MNTDKPEANANGLTADLTAAVIADLLKERQSDRKWTLAKRWLFACFSVTVGLLSLSEPWSSFAPWSDRVALVKISGPIGADERASAKNLIPVLEAAYEDSHTKMVALQIDSPGGAPFEAERINATIDYYREKTKIPTYAFIENTGASAAYLIALHADKLFAGRFSLVGSIGAIMEGWDFHEIMEKADVGHRVYASGIFKDMLNPFSAMTPQSERKAQDMVDKMAGTFENEFRRIRGGKLKAGVDYFTGEVWDGGQALALGVVDAVDSIENVVRREFGPDMKIHEFGPRDKNKSPFKMLSQDFFDSLSTVFQEAAIGFLARQASSRPH